MPCLPIVLLYRSDERFWSAYLGLCAKLARWVVIKWNAMRAQVCNDEPSFPSVIQLDTCDDLEPLLLQQRWPWTAPEIFAQGLYSSKSDVWAYGVAFWEIMTLGATPFIGCKHSRDDSCLDGCSSRRTQSSIVVDLYWNNKNAWWIFCSIRTYVPICSQCAAFPTRNWQRTVSARTTRLIAHIQPHTWSVL